MDNIPHSYWNHSTFRPSSTPLLSFSFRAKARQKFHRLCFCCHRFGFCADKIHGLPWKTKGKTETQWKRERKDIVDNNDEQTTTTTIAADREQQRWMREKRPFVASRSTKYLWLSRLFPFQFNSFGALLSTTQTMPFRFYSTRLTASTTAEYIYIRK